jgi:hypothetical protein
MILRSPTPIINGKDGLVMMDEQWITVPAFPKYEVSSLGKVRVIESKKILQPSLSKKRRYPAVDLRAGNKRKTFALHRLVIETFSTSKPLGLECNHKDGNKLNASLSNLEWVTRTENIRHARSNGLTRNPPHTPGSIHGQAKLNEADIFEIRSSNLSQSELGRIFGVSRNTIWKIIHRVNWTHV